MLLLSVNNFNWHGCYQACPSLGICAVVTAWVACIVMIASSRGVPFLLVSRDLATIGDSVLIGVTKDGIKFSTSGDIGSANISVRSVCNLFYWSWKMAIVHSMSHFYSCLNVDFGRTFRAFRVRCLSLAVLCDAGKTPVLWTSLRTSQSLTYRNRCP